MFLRIPPPPTFSQLKLVPVLGKIKQSYQQWYALYAKIPKIHRYTLALKIDSLFVELIEMTASATFLKKNDKLPYLRTAIRKLDTLKILLHVLWETRSISNEAYATLTFSLEEVGRMLGGWLGQTEKQEKKQESESLRASARSIIRNKQA